MWEPRRLRHVREVGPAQVSTVFASDLSTALTAAQTAAQACQGTVDVLADHTMLASAYLQQGDRLRCLGVHGYWQIFDGMLETGVIGRTFLTGERSLVRGVGASPDYLEAAPSVVDELCVPLRVDGVVVGVLNIESLATLSTAHEAMTDNAARALAHRLGQLSLPVESNAQKLGRHAARLSHLAATVDGGALQEAVLEAATDISGLSSTVLCLEGVEGLSVTAASGPLADTYHALPREELARIAAWVATGTSSYTVGTTEGAGFPGHEQLRGHGTGSLVVLPLRAAGVGMLVVATAEVIRLPSAVVELLELLAAVVDSCLVIADGMRSLRDRADTDALTGLGHHASFHATLAPARSVGDAHRLAVLYVDIDHFKAVNDSSGHAAGDVLLLAIADSMRGALRSHDRLFRIGGDEFAAMAEIEGVEQALALGERLRSAVLEQTGATVSVGVAVAEPEESDACLLARADAAVYAAKAAGRARVQLAELAIAPG